MKFIGRGVFTHKGKKYSNGDDMPNDVPKATMDMLKKNKQVGDIVEVVTDEKGEIIERLKEQIVELKEQVNGGGDVAQAEHDAVVKERDDLQDQLDGVKKQVVELEEQVNGGGDVAQAEHDAVVNERDDLQDQLDGVKKQVADWVTANPDMAKVLEQLDGMKGIIAKLDGSGNKEHKEVVVELKKAAGVED